MWGITILLMRLSDYLHSRKADNSCKVCNYMAKDKMELENHYRQKHPP